MERIIYPLKLQMQGQGVADLQEGLTLLLEKGYTNEETYIEHFHLERTRNIFGEATKKLVQLFQSQNQLEASGEVDKHTSVALNTILEEIGAFHAVFLSNQLLVGGKVWSETVKPIAGNLVRAFHVDEQGIIRLGEDKTDADGRYTIYYSSLPGVDNLQLRVDVFDKGGNVIGQSYIIDEVKPLEIVDLKITSMESVIYQVEGRVASRVSAGVGGLIVRIFDKRIGEDVKLAETFTNDEGNYFVRFNDEVIRKSGKEKPDLQAQVFADNTFIGASEVLYNASNHEILDLSLEDSVVSLLRSEYETLTGTLTSQFKGNLRDLQETNERQDITHLANKTGWDARAVAIAVLADQFSARSTKTIEGTGIEPAFFYALFRSGLPANEVALYQTDMKALERIWRQAIKQGVISSDLEKDIPEAVEKFQKLAIKRTLEDPALIGASSLKEILSLTFENDPERQKQFAEIYIRNRGDSSEEQLQRFWDSFRELFSLEDNLKQKRKFFELYLKNKDDLLKLWEAVRDLFMLDGYPEQKGKFAELYHLYIDNIQKFWIEVRNSFGEIIENRLKLDGQLAYLTLNNAPLIKKLHASNGRKRLTSPLNLVEEGYYSPEKWKGIIENTPIPQEVPGINQDEKKVRYAELLSEMVKVSFPTAVVAKNIIDEDIRLKNDVNGQTGTSLKDKVHLFLMEHQGSFEIGVQPIEQYINENNLQIPNEVTKEVARIQRVYQITSGDEAMTVLLKKGVDSAYKVVCYEQSDFVQTFQDNVGGEANARLIYEKAQQVHNSVLNIALSYITAKKAPAIGEIVIPEVEGIKNKDVQNVYPTLEGLFGEMDYCACGHCRSLLSPAAYLVELLEFIDRDANVWSDFLARWKSIHEGIPYPFTDQESWIEYQNQWKSLYPDRPLSNKENEVTPFEELVSRRPDLIHLPLTCENTNITLPYIDLVNETLEYYVTHNLSLEKYRGYSTSNETTSEELMANPQFVREEAYNVLKGEVNPVHKQSEKTTQPILPPNFRLPFHQPLETMRRYFGKFNATLSGVMEELYTGDKTSKRSKQKEYNWRDILLEELRLSCEEYRILTERQRKLQQLYGYHPDTQDPEILADLSNVKSFIHRVGISFEEITEILKTSFINPNAILIPRVERLGVTFTTLKNFKENLITPEQFDKELSPHLDESKYGGDIKAWVKYEN
ncbi:peptidoglycan-binding protein [Bacillus cereus]|nr:peptidoglycan-binding protein [Bacillus cereus]